MRLFFYFLEHEVGIPGQVEGIVFGIAVGIDRFGLLPFVVEVDRIVGEIAVISIGEIDEAVGLIDHRDAVAG